MAPVTLEGPAGRIQVTPGSTFYPGTRFMNVDLAQWLERTSSRRGQELE